MLPFIEKLLDHPKSVLLGTVIIFILASMGCMRLEFTTNYRIFFSEQNPHLQAFEALQNTYTKNDNVLFVITPKAGGVFTKDTLFAIQQITKEAWQLPYSIRVDSITNYQHTYAQEDDLVVGDLVEAPQALNENELEALKDIALNEPLLANKLVSQNAEVTGVNVTVQLPGENDAVEVPLVSTAANALKQKYAKLYPDIEFRVTGLVMQNQAFTDSSILDASTLMPLMFLAIFVGVGLFFRSFTTSVMIIVMMVLSIFPALGIAGWLGMKLNTATMAAPIMIMTLAVADAVHLFTNFFQSFREKSEKKKALIESLRINAQPIFLTSVTTILGFMSLNFSDAPPFRELGNIVAMGVAWALIFSLTTLPAMIRCLPIRPHPSQHQSKKVLALADWVINKQKPLFWGIGSFCVVCICFIPKNELSDVWVEYFSPKLEFRQQADYALKNLTGFTTLNYSLKAEGPEGISEPSFLNHVESFANWLKEQPEVVHVSSITDTFKRLNKNLHADDPKFYKLPQERTLSAQYLLLYELSLPYGLDLNNQINVDKSSTRVHVVLGEISTNELLALEQRVQLYQQTHLPKEMRAAGTSPDLMFAYIGFTNIRSMLMGTTIALLLISMMLILAFRSVKHGLISLLPNLLPAGVAFGLWGIFIGEVGLSLSVVTGMTLGIIVDDTIHFMSKYLRARKDQTSEQAVRYAFATVGQALIVTTVVLVIGFGILSLSSFKLNATMGLLTAITISLALLIDFLFLPPCIIWLSKKK